MFNDVTRGRRPTVVWKLEVPTVPPFHSTSRGPPTLSDTTFMRSPSTLYPIWYSRAREGYRMSALLRRIGIELPVVQAPMAGVSTPKMAAAVANAGGLGSIGIGAADPET